MDRNLALDFIRVTEAAAMASARWVGKGEKEKADDAAVEMMRKTFAKMDIDGTVVIGEGERDEAPMLYIGEKIGSGKGFGVDIAVDPVEGTNSVAYGRPNAIAVLAASPKGTMLHAPDTYMDKIAVGPQAHGQVSLEGDVAYNIEQTAKALDKKPKDITVVVLDRERHNDLIKDIRKCDSRIVIIKDGDVSGAISPSIPDNEIDMLLGVGAAPEGVLAAAAIACTGGYMEGRFKFRDDDDIKRAEGMGVKKLDEIMHMKDMLDCDKAIFAATGITTGSFLKGVRFTKEGAETHSVVMRSRTKTVRYVEGHHKFEDEPEY